MSTAPQSLTQRQIMPVRIIKREDKGNCTRGDSNYIRARYLEKLRVVPRYYPRHTSQVSSMAAADDDQSSMAESYDHCASLSSSVSSCQSSVVPPPPRPSLLSSSSLSSSRSLPSPSCLRHKRSVLHTTPAKRERVSFNQDVRLYRIKSHQDYSDEEWNNMWVDPDALDYAKDRNSYEYQADGADWQNATEEDAFMELPRADGTTRTGASELVHPATWVAYKQASVAATATGTVSNNKGRINFAALLSMAQQQRRSSSRRGRRSSWSPRPTQQRKKSLSFWLLDLAIDSVQKGKNQAAKSASNRASAVNNMSRWQQQQSQQQTPVRMGFP